MRLDVIHPHLSRGRKRAECTELISDLRENFGRRQSELGPAKIFAIGETGMRSDRHISFLGRDDRTKNRRRIARVKTAGDAGGRNQLEELIVEPGPFAEIGVKIDMQAHEARRLSPVLKYWRSRSRSHNSR